MYLSVYLSVYLSICLSLFLSVYLSIYLYLYLHIRIYCPLTCSSAASPLYELLLYPPFAALQRPKPPRHRGRGPWDHKDFPRTVDLQNLHRRKPPAVELRWLLLEVKQLMCLWLGGSKKCKNITFLCRVRFVSFCFPTNLPQKINNPCAAVEHFSKRGKNTS